MVTSSKNAMGLALDTLVPTPTGWLKAGDLQIGNKVLLSDGTAAEVKNMEVTEAKTFSLTFTGVAPLVTAEGQLWSASNRADRTGVGVSTRKNNGKRSALALRYAESIKNLLMEDLDMVTMTDLLSKTCLSEDMWRIIMKRIRNKGIKIVQETFTVPGFKGSFARYDAKELLQAALDDQLRIAEANSLKTQANHVYETADIAASVFYRNYRNWCLPSMVPLQISEAQLPLEPYVLGLWLADGTASMGTITMGGDDLDYLLAHLKGLGIKHRKLAKEMGRNAWRTTFESTNGVALTTSLREVDLLNNKHIPTEYLRASYGQRLALLQGLLDGDGFIDKKGKCELCFTRKELADDAAELLRTFGLLVSMKESEAAYRKNGERIVTGTRYRMHFTTELPVFSLPRKAEKLPESVQERYKRHYLDSAEPAGTQLVKSIYLGEQKQFLVGDFIPTLSAD